MQIDRAANGETIFCSHCNKLQKAGLAPMVEGCSKEGQQRVNYHQCDSDRLTIGRERPSRSEVVSSESVSVH